MFQKLTDDLLDLRATARTGGTPLLAWLPFAACCCSSCCSSRNANTNPPQDSK